MPFPLPGTGWSSRLSRSAAPRTLSPWGSSKAGHASRSALRLEAGAQGGLRSGSYQALLEPSDLGFFDKCPRGLFLPVLPGFSSGLRIFASAFASELLRISFLFVRSFSSAGFLSDEVRTSTTRRLRLFSVVRPLKDGLFRVLHASVPRAPRSFTRGLLHAMRLAMFASPFCNIREALVQHRWRFSARCRRGAAIRAQVDDNSAPRAAPRGVGAEMKGALPRRSSTTSEHTEVGTLSERPIRGTFTDRCSDTDRRCRQRHCRQRRC